MAQATHTVTAKVSGKPGIPLIVMNLYDTQRGGLQSPCKTSCSHPPWQHGGQPDRKVIFQSLIEKV